jgi:hypothetical protein
MTVETSANADDIFDFCNRLAWQVGGPVLIHDADWGVVAYSNLPQPMDEWRRMAILRRQIPLEHYVFDGEKSRADMIANPDHMHTMDAVPGKQERRTFVPVMVMNALVGSIWVAESAGDLHPDTEEILLTAAKQAGVYFRARTDEKRREAEIFLSMLLDGGHDEEFLGQCLAIAPGHWVRVIGIWHRDAEAVKSHLANRCSEFAEGFGLRALCLPRSDRVHGLLHGTGSADAMDESTSRLATQLLSSIPDAYVGIGSTVRLGGVPASRHEADQVLDYLCRHPDQHLAAIDEVRTGVALMELAESLSRELDSTGSSLSALRRLNPADRDETIGTLDAYFAAMGNISEAARLLHVHPNTLRYRLTKIADVLEVDLDDRETRLLLELELLAERYRQ